MLHGAPSAEDKYLFAKQNRWSLCIAGVISTCILLTGNIFFVTAHPGFWFFGIFIAVTTFYLLISYLVAFAGREFDLDAHNNLVNKWFSRTAGASVDIYLPVCGEPYEVIKNTWAHVFSLQLLHENVNVYVLDDGKSDDLKGLADQLRFQYIRRSTNELKKAGNLRNAFSQTSGEFIVILDADFCPRGDFLIETLPYLMEDEKVAIVQTPQYFKNYNWLTWIQNGAGSIQELFYRLIQVNRNAFNGAICVGTNAVYRRKALEPFGGTAPIAYSEDVHTGFQVITRGWRISYIPVVLAEGLCPESIRQYFTQQYRWAMGSISLFFSRKFWGENLSAMQRVCYLSGMFFYITTGLSVVFGPLPSIIMLSFFPEKIHWYNLLFSVPSFAFATCFMWYWQKTPMSMSQMRARHLSYFSHLAALKDYLFDSLEEWKPTGAKTSSQRYDTFKKIFSIHSVLTTVFIFAFVGFRVGQGYEFKNFAILLIFTQFHLILVAPIIKEIWSKEK